MPTYNSYVSGRVYDTVTIGSSKYPGPLEVESSGFIRPSTATAAINGEGTGQYTLGIEAGGDVYGGNSSGPTGTGGIGVDLSSGIVTNSGRILGGSGYTGANGGVGVSMSGTLTNSTGALIQGGYDYNGDGTGGVGVKFSQGTLTNDAMADIFGGGLGFGYRGTPTGSGGDGIDLGASATVNNSGNISGGGGPQSGFGSYPFIGSYGIKATSSTDSITNFSGGQITGGDGYTTAGAAIVASGGATVTNNAGAIIAGGTGDGSGTSGVGVEISGGTLTNDGKIKGGSSPDDGVGGVGVTMASGAKVYDNSGTYGIYGGGGVGNGAGVDLNGGTLYVAGKVEGGGGGAGDAVVFGSAVAKMTVDSGAKFYGHIGGFNTNSSVYITGLDKAQVFADFHGTYSTTHTLTLGTHDVLQFDGSFAGESFVLTNETGGTLLTVTCYRRGTRILTERGEVAIESLRIGDQVTMLSGASRPIRWIGRRSYSGDVVWGNRDVLPILIRQGAIAKNVPTRDLWVSPEHAMYIDEMLIPAALLVNGVSIVQEERVDEVTYFHLEFNSHEVIVAEGAPSESFVDDESRQLFDNVSEYHELYPQSAAQSARFCAPRVEDGYELEAVRQRLAARAESGRSASSAESLAHRNRIGAASTQLRL
jgi:Hint domain-containing protein